MSLFSSRRHAHCVLNEAISPFVTQYSELGALKSWFFELNSHLGENIRLSLLVPFDQAPKMARNAKKHFRLFFFERGLAVKPLSFPLAGIFLPFPENSIQFGLYRVTVEKTEFDEGDWDRRVSAILLEALAKEEIDDETVFSLCLYLHLTLKREFLCLCPANESLFKEFYETSDSIAGTPSVLTVWQEKLEDNKAVLKEICTDISDSTFYERQNWLSRWATLCAEAIRHEDSENQITRLVFLINKQLGVSASQFEVVRYFVLSSWHL